MNNNIAMNYVSKLKGKAIYFRLKMCKNGELKLIDIFKDENKIKNMTPSVDMLLYRCPIYKKNLVYVNNNAYTTLKNFINEIIRINTHINHEAKVIR